MVVNEFRVLLLGVKKWKAWNKIREKYMPVKRRQSLTESGDLTGDPNTKRNG